MKRLLVLILAAVLLLSSCGSAKYDDLDAAIKATAELNSYTADLFMEISFYDGSVNLLSRQGTFSLDREKKQLYSVESQTLLGASVKVTTFYDAGYLYDSSGSSRGRYKMDADEVFAMFPYEGIEQFEQGSVKKLNAASNGSGTLYTFYVKDAADLEAFFAGDEIYTLTMLAKPQKDKTTYGDLKCEYTVDTVDGRQIVRSRLFEFDMTVFDTPPYAAGANVNEDDYKLDLHFRIKINIKKAGNEFILSEYNVADYVSEAEEK